MTRGGPERIGFLAARWRDLVAAGRLMRDPEVPIPLKAIPILGLLYLVWPVDLISDLIVGPGQVDDVGLLLASIALFLSLVPDARLRLARGEPDEPETVEGRTRPLDRE